MTVKEKFVLLVQTKAIIRDIQRNANVAGDAVAWALTVPEDFLTEENWREAAEGVLDFEYGDYDRAGDYYPEWVKRYIRFKMPEMAERIIAGHTREVDSV